MSGQRRVAEVDDSDLDSYQKAVRLVLTHDLITSTRPRPGVLERVLRWADPIARDLRALCGYTLIATTGQVRLIRRFDVLDPTRGKVFVTKSKRPFDRRRLAYLCLVLSTFQRSRIEVSLTDLIGAFTPLANATDGLGYDGSVQGHKAAVVDVLSWLLDREALRVSDGSLNDWAHDDGDALFDIDHDICALLLRPPRPLQHLASAAGLLEEPSGPPLERVRRLLLERPVVYYEDLDAEAAAVLQGKEVADELAWLTGLRVERRAEGVALVDPTGSFTDKPFPGRGAAVGRMAGLMIAKIVQALNSGSLAEVEAPAEAGLQAELLARVDSALPETTFVDALAWTPPAGTTGRRPSSQSLRCFVARNRLEQMATELYEGFGVPSFPVTWQSDPLGLLDAALVLLADLRLIQPIPGGVLLQPAALRYRTLMRALPDTGGQLDLFAQEQP